MADSTSKTVRVPDLAAFARQVIEALDEVDCVESEYDGRVHTVCPWCNYGWGDDERSPGGHRKGCTRQALMAAAEAIAPRSPKPRDLRVARTPRSRVEHAVDVSSDGWRESVQALCGLAETDAAGASTGLSLRPCAFDREPFRWNPKGKRACGGCVRAHSLPLPSAPTVEGEVAGEVRS